MREAERHRTRNPRTSNHSPATRSNLPLFPEKTAVADFIRRHKLMEFEKSRLTLGATTLKFHHHPGHTPGVLSAEFTVYDNGMPHKALWQGGGGSRGGLPGAQQAMETAKRLGDLQGVEVFVMIHSWLPYPKGGVFERAELLAKRKPGDPHPFVDPASFAEYVRRNEANAAGTLEEEKKKAGIVQ